MIERDRGVAAVRREPAHLRHDLEADRLTVEVVDSEAGFDALRSEWTELVSQLELPSPFQSWEWQRAWWRHFANPKHDRLNLLVLRRAGALVGVAPLKLRTRLGFKELSPLGWRDRITEHLVLLFPSAERARLMEELCNWLSTQKWTSVGLPQLSPDQALPGVTASEVVSSQAIVFEHVALPSSWKELDARLSRSMRSNLRYYPNLMARDGHRYSFEIARTPEEMLAALPLLWVLHTARANAPTTIRHGDYLRYPRRRAFLLEVMPLLAARGEAAAGLLRVDGEIVAGQLWLEQNGVVFLYYSGFKPAWARYSVAMITTAEIFKAAITRGVGRIEFLRGANQFKSRWGSESRIETEFVLARRRRIVLARETYVRQSKSLRRKMGRWRTKLQRITSRGL